jgi:hypothetical protein
MQFMGFIFAVFLTIPQPETIIFVVMHAAANLAVISNPSGNSTKRS